MANAPRTPAQAARDAFVAFLTKELGTDNIDRAKTYMEDALRMTVHLVMSAWYPDRIAAALPPVANGSAPASILREHPQQCLLRTTVVCVSAWPRRGGGVVVRTSAVLSGSCENDAVFR